MRTSTARAAGIRELQILVDSHEQYAYHFAAQQATTVKRALPCGDFGITAAGQLVAAVERKSLAEGKVFTKLDITSQPAPRYPVEQPGRRHASLTRQPTCQPAARLRCEPGHQANGLRGRC